MESAFRLYKVATSLMSSGGLFLHKWNFNSHSLLKLISANQEKHEDQPQTPHQIIFNSPSSGGPGKLLGVQ